MFHGSSPFTGFFINLVLITRIWSINLLFALAPFFLFTPTILFQKNNTHIANHSSSLFSFAPSPPPPVSLPGLAVRPAMLAATRAAGLAVTPAVPRVVTLAVQRAVRPGAAPPTAGTRRSLRLMRRCRPRPRTRRRGCPREDRRRRTGCRREDRRRRTGCRSALGPRSVVAAPLSVTDPGGSAGHSRMI